MGWGVHNKPGAPLRYAYPPTRARFDRQELVFAETMAVSRRLSGMGFGVVNEWGLV
jgi:hypothetical protein